MKITQLISIVCSILLVQVELKCFAEQLTQVGAQAWAAIPITPASKQLVAPTVLKFFTEPKNYEDAKDIIQVAEKREITSLIAVDDFKEFDFLMSANVLVKFIEEKDIQDFRQWWLQNKTSLLSEIPKMGANVSWQVFLTNIYVEFKINKTKAKLDPTEFVEWMNSIIFSPWVKQASAVTLTIITGIFGFLTGVIYGAMVSGPAAGFINAFLEPLLRPIREKGMVVGIRLFGKTGKAINSVMFDSIAKENLMEELKNTKNSIQDVRSLITTDIYTLSQQQWLENIQTLYHSWNHLNYVWNKMPDAYKGGRDRMTDHLIVRPREFSNSVTQAITAAEVHRQGAEQMLDRIILKSSAPNQVEKLSAQLYKVIQEQMQIERSQSDLNQTQRSLELQIQIDELRVQLISSGGSSEQVTRVIENYKRIFVFTGQAATVLAGQILHDAEFSDFITQARGAFEAMRAGNCLQFFHRELAEEVRNILDRLNFEIDLNLKALDANGSLPDKNSQTLNIISKINASHEGLRVLEEPGSLTKSEPKNIRSAVRK